MNLLILSTNIILCDYLPNKEIRVLQNDDFIIDTCYFYRNTMYSGYGGIVYVSGVLSNMKLISCIFFECCCSIDGGAIYFYSQVSGTNVELNKICGNKCYVENTKKFQFGLILTPSNINSNNICNFCSISNCNNKTNGYCSFNLYFGNISLNNLNSSKNINKQESGINIRDPSKFNSNFCSFINNNVSEYTCIFLHGDNNNYISYYNVINNNSPTNCGVITNNVGYYSINNSIFINNTNVLFYVYSGQLSILNSKISHDNNFITYQNTVSTFNNIFELTNTFLINHLNTYLCLGYSNYNLINITHKKKSIFFLILILFVNLIY